MRQMIYKGSLEGTKTCVLHVPALILQMTLLSLSYILYLPPLINKTNFIGLCVDNSLELIMVLNQ